MKVNFHLLPTETAFRLLFTPPSEISDIDILAIEGSLNTLYQHIVEEKMPAQRGIEIIVLNILGLAGQLSSLTKAIPSEKREASFFSGVKKLGKSILFLEFVLENNNDFPVVPEE